MGFTEKKPVDDGELEEEIYEPIEEMISETESVEAEEARQRAAKCVVKLVRPLLTLQMEGLTKFKPRKKHTTYPWDPAPHHGPEILEAPPQLNRVEFSKRERVDAVVLSGHEKFQPLWKSKTKNKEPKEKV